VNNGKVAPFDYKLMSKVLHPNDWDPQDLITPLDMDAEWGGIAKPADFKYPQAYLDAKKSGEMEKVAAEYKSHYKIDMFGRAAQCRHVRFLAPPGAGDCARLPGPEAFDGHRGSACAAR